MIICPIIRVITLSVSLSLAPFLSLPHHPVLSPLSQSHIWFQFGKKKKKRYLYRAVTLSWKV